MVIVMKAALWDARDLLWSLSMEDHVLLLLIVRAGGKQLRFCDYTFGRVGTISGVRDLVIHRSSLEHLSWFTKRGVTE